MYITLFWDVDFKSYVLLKTFDEKRLSDATITFLDSV